MKLKILILFLIITNFSFSDSYIDKLFVIDGVFLSGAELKYFDKFFSNTTNDINRNILEEDLSNDIYLVTRVVSKEKFTDMLLYLKVEIVEPEILKSTEINFECGFNQGSEYFIKKVFSYLSIDKNYKDKILKMKPIYKIKKSLIK